MRWKHAALVLVVSSCSANKFSEEEKKASQCLAMSIVLRNIAERTGAPSKQINTLRIAAAEHMRIFQNAVTQIAEKNGDLNSYSSMTKATMTQVAENPAAWERKFRECAI